MLDMLVSILNNKNLSDLGKLTRTISAFFTVAAAGSNIAGAAVKGAVLA